MQNTFDFLLFCICSFLFFLGLLCFLSGLCVKLHANLKWGHCRQRVDGTIVNIRRKETRVTKKGAKPHYITLVIQYHRFGTLHTKYLTVKNRRHTYFIGQSIVLYIDPEHPVAFCLKEEKHRNLVRMLLLVGLFFVADSIWIGFLNFASFRLLF